MASAATDLAAPAAPIATGTAALLTTDDGPLNKALAENTALTKHGRWQDSRPRAHRRENPSTGAKPRLTALTHTCHLVPVSAQAGQRPRYFNAGVRTASPSSVMALMLMDDLRGRLANRVQLTTDGHRAYLQAVEEAFGADIDYSMLIKLYGEPPSLPEAARRYSPSECVGTRTENITGNPDPKHVSTSYAERANLTMRMAMRRFTRLTNAFSKKLENHAHMVALYALWYNFVRIHKTLRVTPAMAAGIETRLWSMEDVVRLIEQREDLRSGARLVG